MLGVACRNFGIDEVHGLFVVKITLHDTISIPQRFILERHCMIVGGLRNFKKTNYR